MVGQYYDSLRVGTIIEDKAKNPNNYNRVQNTDQGTLDPKDCALVHCVSAEGAPQQFHKNGEKAEPGDQTVGVTPNWAHQGCTMVSMKENTTTRQIPVAIGTLPMGGKGDSGGSDQWVHCWPGSHDMQGSWKPLKQYTIDSETSIQDNIGGG